MGWQRKVTVASVGLGCAVALALAWDVQRIALDLPVPSYLLVARHGEFLAEWGGEQLGFWPVQALPPRVVAATLALEDRRFYRHPGVDPVAVLRALWQNLVQGSRRSGASTLAMQLARLQQPGRRSYLRKLREAWVALVLTAKYGREEILRAYLKRVPYGNRIHGIAYAARRYLDKPVADLSWAEIAFLAAIPQAPAKANPFQVAGRERAVNRGQRILAVLRHSGILGAGEYELARAQLANLHFPAPAQRPTQAMHAVFKVGGALSAAQLPLAPGAEPYRVVTTLDLSTQRSVADFTQALLQEWASAGASNAAVIVVERDSAAVRAWLGSAGYFRRESAGAMDFAQVKRSPGSVLKPFIFALALERGDITPATVMEDLYPVADSIGNADRAYLGPLLPRQALANSRNVPAINLLKRIGIDAVYGWYRQLGLHAGEAPAQQFGAGLAIGALPVSLESVLQAYTVLANDGMLRTLRWSEAQPLREQRLLSATSARLVSAFLADPQARLPSFPRMGNTEFAMPVAAKTGTSQGFRDAWTVAYSSRYLVGVWLGNEDARPMHQVSGGVSAAKLTQRILAYLHPEHAFGLADGGFVPPADYQRVPLCAVSGLRAGPHCDHIIEEWLSPNDVPLGEDNSFVRAAIDVRSGTLANRDTPPAFTALRTFANLPARYAAWAERQGWLPLPQRVADTAPAPWFAAATGHEITLNILAPGSGAVFLRDPTLPSHASTIALRAEVSTPVPAVLWFVDGEEFALAASPYLVRWPLVPGEHTVQAQIPGTPVKSAVVRIHVE
jgi:penicillin-binding protein 1C